MGLARCRNGYACLGLHSTSTACLSHFQAWPDRRKGKGTKRQIFPDCRWFDSIEPVPILRLRTLRCRIRDGLKTLLLLSKLPVMEHVIVVWKLIGVWKPVSEHISRWCRGASQRSCVALLIRGRWLRSTDLQNALGSRPLPYAAFRNRCDNYILE